jgi:Uma2 family endonuclease
MKSIVELGGKGAMSAAGRLEPLDWRTYLDGEERAERKHEYVFGHVYAMAGGRMRHNLIASNVLVAVGRRLERGPCRAFGSDMKVHVLVEQGHCFYYPDVVVDCGPHDPESVYTDHPTVIVEVLSPSTRRIDEGEKKAGYLTIPSLAAYVLVDSEQPGVVVWRRAGETFKRETYADLGASIALPGVDVTLPLSEVCANVTWPTQPADEEEM